MRSYAHDGLVFDVQDEGPEDGPAVLLLHGFPQDATSWDGVVEPLHAQGFRTLAPDQRGYSPQARPRRTGDYVLARTVADAVALLDEAGVQRAHVVGHDWGGHVAWGLASAFPERVRTLSVISTAHVGAIKKASLRSFEALRLSYMALFQMPWLAEQFISPGSRGWRAVVRGLPPHQAQHYADHMSQPGALHAALNWYRAIPRDLVRPALRVGRITVPTLYLWGELDPAIGPAAARATADFVAAEYTFEAIEGVGHWIPETIPDRVAAALVAHWQRLQVAG
jgi:pimeloyl-ACP methyl ester carboxylesterase